MVPVTTRAGGRTPRTGRRRRLAVVVAAVLGPSAAVAVPAATASTAAGASSPTTAQRDVRYAVEQPLCAPSTSATLASCMGYRLVPATKSTPGARRFVSTSAATAGPKGGYTPADIASAYGFDPALKRPGQTVAVIDWNDDPHALADLNVFDKQYGIATETGRSFRKVNQNGKKSPLPARPSNRDKAGYTETVLDIEAVRAVCNTCRILLVEADSARLDDLVAAENAAYKLGATEISNSWGAPEGPASSYTSAIRTAFDRPGVVITASTGDDGWDGWDFTNEREAPDGSPTFPSSDPNVVAVAGTRLTIGSTGARSAESVWNENGAGNTVGAAQGPLGASGGGCSTVFTAPSWQRSAAGYPAAGCNGMRLAADVAATADPGSGARNVTKVGFDVYDSLGTGGWVTVGGTSLASPLIAAMWALAGGAHGASNPGKTLYDNYKIRRTTSFYDVVSGGNSWCGGESISDCESDAYGYSLNTYSNPNTAVGARVDCSFHGSGTRNAVLSSECNATTGYDGASGIGTPNNLTAFQSPLPTGTISTPAVVTLHRSGKYSVTASDPMSSTITGARWTWGDGSAASTGTTASHTYTSAGTHTITVTLADALGQTGTVTGRVTAGAALRLVIGGPTRLHARTSHEYGSLRSTDPNTGGVIRGVHWRFGDGTGVVAGRTATHTWAKAGTYTVTMTARDNTGVTTSASEKVTVLS